MTHAVWLVLPTLSCLCGPQASGERIESRVPSAADEHWAFQPLNRSAVRVEGPWVKNPIDAFVRRRLEAEGLEPASEAPAPVLLRRLFLDLVGLPPDPERVHAFVEAHRADPDAAVEEVVAELLASPRFGEKWARGWLDLARYADSNGFQADQLRPSWAYRDWVVRAINDNLPFDRFTVEQLAGDLLPDAGLEQRIATGFHRSVTCNVEAGVHAEENRVQQVFDRVNTTATAWLGLTMECAQCHDHKYDPFSMEDYYGLFAYFNNTPLEVEAPSGVSDVSHDFIGPYLDLLLPLDRQAHKAELEERLADRSSARDARLARELPGWISGARASLDEAATWRVLRPASFTTSGQEEVRKLEDGSVLLTGPVPERVTYSLELEGDGRGGTMLRLEALTHPEIAGGGPGRGDPERTNFVLSELELVVGEQPVPLARASADFEQKGWPAQGAIDGDPKSGWAIAPRFGEAHSLVVVPAAPLGPEPLRLELHQDWGQGRVIGRLRVSISDGDPRMGALPPEVAACLSRAEGTLADADRELLEGHFAAVDPELLALDEELAELRAALLELRPDRTLVMVELESPRTTRVLERGDYLRPAQAVAPHTPLELPPMDASEPPNRLGLARWIVSADNPLTPRVAVNRWWAELFGRGIVATLEDFGSQAEPPTHPELLDWLACELLASGWDRKHVLGTIVSSATYRQDSRQTPALRERDREGLLYARGPRFRLPAESIRDSALAAAGLLSERMYGPPVMPYQPPRTWNAVGRGAPKWVEAQDEDRFRRGLYVVWRRAAPYPSFVTFDAPDRASCVLARPRTNTALQALALLCDPVYLEAALGLAQRALAEAPGDPLARAFELVLSRPMDAGEEELLRAAYGERLDHFRAHPEKARDWVASAAGVIGEGSYDPFELAAYMHVAHVLLNLDEAVTKG